MTKEKIIKELELAILKNTNAINSITFVTSGEELERYWCYLIGRRTALLETICIINNLGGNDNG